MWVTCLEWPSEWWSSEKNHYRWLFKKPERKSSAPNELPCEGKVTIKHNTVYIYVTGIQYKFIPKQFRNMIVLTMSLCLRIVYYCSTWSVISTMVKTESYLQLLIVLEWNISWMRYKICCIQHRKDNKYWNMFTTRCIHTHNNHVLYCLRTCSFCVVKKSFLINQRKHGQNIMEKNDRRCLLNWWYNIAD